MPAIERLFIDGPLPETVALDTDFILTVLVGSESFHLPCTEFTRLLVRERVRVTYSPLLRLEFLHAWQKAMRRKSLPDSLTLQQRLWDDAADERRALYEIAERLLDDFLDLFAHYQVRFTKALQRETREQMALHNLKPMDACLVASAYRAGTNHIVSLDSDFRRVDDLHLWNDLIPAKRQAARRRKRS